jgi:ribosomal protein RSM22 (predicted rRNA methylase)
MKAWEGTKKALILLEPGTPKGFSYIRYIREQLLSRGAKILAPCTHAGSCPMADGDWCHFSERLNRSFTHRYVKGASMGYEDEKISYLIVTKKEYPTQEARILRPPWKKGGHVLLKLCSKGGVEERIVARRDKEIYLKTKKCRWGDTISFSEEKSMENKSI